MPSVRGFLLKDLKQCLRKEHCDVSKIQTSINLILNVCYLSVYYSSNLCHILFLFYQNALRISSNVPGAKVLVFISKFFCLFDVKQLP